jgi:hypothetical protein
MGGATTTATATATTVLMPKKIITIQFFSGKHIHTN